MRGFLQGLRITLKYGAYITVFVDVIGYAIEKFENLENKKIKQNDSNNTEIQK